MATENVRPSNLPFAKAATAWTAEYDPFVRGPWPVGVRTIEARDRSRSRRFPCEVWYPATAQYAGQDLASTTQDVFMVLSANSPRSQMAVRNAAAESGTYPLIIFSHPSGGHRRSATFLSTHLSSHGFVVAAVDHSEVVAQELARKEGETEEQKTARWQAVIAARVPDIRILLDQLLNDAAWAPKLRSIQLRLESWGIASGMDSARYK
jgi:predicted dienelactone hydrolase